LNREFNLIMHRNYLEFGILAGNFGTMIVHGDEFKTTQDTYSASYKTAFTSSTGGRLSDPGYLLACLTLTMNFLRFLHDKLIHQF
jgi:hypothetical protein